MNTSNLVQQSRRLRQFLNQTLIIVAFLLGPALPQLDASELRAGLARIDISPIKPVTLAGYQSRRELSQGQHDPLSARAVAFEQDGHRLVLVSTDNLGFYGGTAETIRNAIVEATGLKPSELFLCAIHTHSAPSLTLDASRGHTNNVEYTRRLQQQLLELVQAALSREKGVKLGAGSGSSPVGVNRRQVIEAREGQAPKIILGRNPSVITDREVQVLKLSDAREDRLMGVLFAYATHSTSLGPNNYIISGDVHGLAEQFLERYLGPDVVAPGFAGASGDIDPWVRVLPDFRTNNGWVPEPVLLGTMLGEEVARVNEAIRTDENQTAISSSLTAIQLPAKSTSGKGPTVPFNISVAHLGDTAFVGWGGEVFNEVGRTVKAGSPYARTFVFTHCNGTAGYVPTRKSYDEGGYEVQTSTFAPGAAEQLAEETLRLLRQLKSGGA